MTTSLSVAIGLVHRPAASPTVESCRNADATGVMEFVWRASLVERGSVGFKERAERARTLGGTAPS